MSQNKSLEKQEPLLIENPKRFVTFPIVDKECWEMYKKAVASFWTPEEINLTQDRIDWAQKLNDDERFFITRILAFFAASDGIVIENLGERFRGEVQLTEAKSVYCFQIAIENIHRET